MKDMKTNSMIKRMVFIIIAMCIGFAVEAQVTKVYGFSVVDQNGDAANGASIIVTTSDPGIAVIDRGVGDYTVDNNGDGYVYIKIVGNMGTATITINFELGSQRAVEHIVITVLEGGSVISKPEAGNKKKVKLGTFAPFMFEYFNFLDLKKWVIKEE